MAKRLKKRGPGRPRKSRCKAAGAKLGKACCLQGSLFKEWTEHLLATGPTWLFVLTLLSHMLCLRVTEACKLKSEHFDWRKGCVVIGALKRQPAVLKHMMTAVLPRLKQLRKQGVGKFRVRENGARAKTRCLDKWMWPASGYLFPSKRVDAVKPHINKNSVCKAIARVRSTFAPKGFTGGATVRSHSARHRMINDMKCSEVPDEIGMMVARITDKRVYHGYGQLSSVQTATALERNKKFKKLLLQLYPVGKQK